MIGHDDPFDFHIIAMVTAASQVSSVNSGRERGLASATWRLAAKGAQEAAPDRLGSVGFCLVVSDVP